MSAEKLSWRDMLTNRRLGVIALLGFASGLPLALTAGTLQAWATDAGVGIVSIGFLTLVGQAYVLKFLWAPLLDRYVPPFLGRRRGWMLVAQVGLIIGIAAMGLFDPGEKLMPLAWVAVVVAFLSATQDIAIDAYRTDVLKPAERGLGAALGVGGYRLAMIASGGLALIIADRAGWQNTYFLMAAIMLIGVFATMAGPDPEQEKPPVNLFKAVVEPFLEFFSRDGVLVGMAFLVLIVLYKMGDAFAQSLTTAFLLRGMEFTLTDVGAVNKIMGIAATIVGVFAGGVVIARVGLFWSLFWFGVLQAVTNLGFMIMSTMEKSYSILVTVIGLENLAGGMGTAAFVAFLMALCNHRYTATQFALLSSLAVIGRVYVGPAAGIMVDSMGWTPFYLFTFVVAWPGVIMLWFLRRWILPLDDNQAGTGNG